MCTSLATTLRQEKQISLHSKWKQYLLEQFTHAPNFTLRLHRTLQEFNVTAGTMSKKHVVKPN